MDNLRVIKHPAEKFIDFMPKTKKFYLRGESKCKHFGETLKLIEEAFKEIVPFFEREDIIEWYREKIKDIDGNTTRTN